MANSQNSLQFKPEVVYEDEYLLAVDKPAGMVVNEAQTVKGYTLQQWMSEKLDSEKGMQKTINNKQQWQALLPKDFKPEFGSPEEIFNNRQGLVHRLDKDTSGVLLLAKDPGTLVNLLNQFKQRQIRKKYLCLVHGELRVNSSTIRAPIARSSIDKFKFSVAIEGRLATTYYRVTDYYSSLNLTLDSLQKKYIKQYTKSYYQGFSLLECLPETGRTHQIRVHLAHIKHPLVSDMIYGGDKRSKLDRLWCPRQFLHAFQIQFIHPVTGKKIMVEAELAKDLREVLRLLIK